MVIFQVALVIQDCVTLQLAEGDMLTRLRYDLNYIVLYCIILIVFADSSGTSSLASQPFLSLQPDISAFDGFGFPLQALDSQNVDAAVDNFSLLSSAIDQYDFDDDFTSIFDMFDIDMLGTS